MAYKNGKFEKNNAPKARDRGYRRDEPASGELDENVIIGRNAVKELLSGGRDIDRLYITSGVREGSINLLIGMAKERGISYLTAGEKETRAWTIERGTKAPQAAGKIHSDFEKGFIRADVVNWEILITLGSIAAAKEKGKVRSEGKEYVMQDGDVVEYYFNVSKSNK